MVFFNSIFEFGHMSLWSDFLNNNDKIIHKVPHYFPVYEIGVYKGGSLQMWKKYFGSFVQIIGIDIKEKLNDFEGDWHQVEWY